MKSLTTAAVIAGTAFATAMGMAQAADLYPEPPYEEPPYIEPLPEMELRGGVYVRGFVGMTNQRLGKLDFIELHDPDFDYVFLDKGGFDSGPLFGVGLGYTFNEWFRVDVTAEYRGKVDFQALDRGTWVGPGEPDEWNNKHSAKKSEWLLLANAYLDLGTWKGLTPYVGAGIGASRNTISHYRDLNPRAWDEGNEQFVTALWYAPSASKWNFAWALHAGLGFDVTDQLTLDLAYRYVDLGHARTGTVFDAGGFEDPLTPVHFRRLTSHDIMLGLRWNFGHKSLHQPLDDFPMMVKK